MATDNTRRENARHEIGHTALSLIGSLAIAPIPVEDAIGRVHTIAALVDYARDEKAYANGQLDLQVLRGYVEDILRNHANAPTMENVVRHCHELRRKVREYQRMIAGGI